MTSKYLQEVFYANLTNITVPILSIGIDSPEQTV